MFHFQVQNNKEDFKELTGAEWIDEMVVRSPLEDIYKPDSRELIHQPRIKALYSSFVSPKLYIRKGVAPGRHTLHTLEKIPKGTFVTEYLGEWITEGPSSNYRWGPIDSKHYRNFGAMVDDGFPNLTAFHLYDTDLPLRILFVAIEDIQPDEILTINYGLSHSIKVQEREEHRFEKMASFFSSNSVENCLQKMRQLIPQANDWEACFELEALTAKVQYLFHTPSALEKLLALNILKKDLVSKIFEKIDNRFYLLGFNSPADPRVKRVMDLIRVQLGLTKTTSI